jgi:hypothetical protein
VVVVLGEDHRLRYLCAPSKQVREQVPLVGSSTVRIWLGFVTERSRSLP